MARDLWLGIGDFLVSSFREKQDEGAAADRQLETHFPTLFHTIVTLSAPSGHLPLEGKATIRGYHPLKKGGEAASIQAFPAWGRGTASAVDRVLSYAAQMRLSFPVLPSVFHTASALSAPAGRLPPEGKTDDARIASSHKTFGHRLIYICAAPPFCMSRAGKALKCSKSSILHGLPCFCFSFPTCVII